VNPPDVTRPDERNGRPWCACGDHDRETCAFVFLQHANAHALAGFLATTEPEDAAIALLHLHPKLAAVTLTAISPSKGAKIVGATAAAKEASILIVEAAAARLADRWGVHDLVNESDATLAGAVQDVLAQDRGRNPFLVKKTL
jgi:flagellar motor switch protein FliG